MKTLSFSFLILFISSLTFSSYAHATDLFPMKKGDKWGYINKGGKWVIPAKYQYVFPFSEKRALFQQDGLWGMLDAKGREILPPKYYLNTGSINFTKADPEPMVDYFSEGFIPLAKSYGQFTLFDKKGKPLNTFPYQTVRPAYSGWMAFRSRELSGYMDKTGAVVLSLPSYQEIGNFHDNRALLKKDFFDNFGFINKKGEVVIEPVFHEAKAFSEGLAAVKKEVFDGYGFIDTMGNWVIEPQYNWADRFSEGLAPVGKGDSTYFINKENQVVIPDMVEGQKIWHAQPFHNGLALVKLCPKGEPASIPIEGYSRGYNNVMYAYIDHNGQIIYQEPLADLRQKQAAIKAERIAERAEYEIRKKEEQAREAAKQQRLKASLEGCPPYQSFGDSSAPHYVEISRFGYVSRFYFSHILIAGSSPQDFEFHFPKISSSDQQSYIQFESININQSFFGRLEAKLKGYSKEGFECALIDETKKPITSISDFWSRGTVDSFSVNLPDQPGPDFWKGDIHFTSAYDEFHLVFHINSPEIHHYAVEDTMDKGWVLSEGFDADEGKVKLSVAGLEARLDATQRLAIDYQAGDRSGWSASGGLWVENFTGDGSYYGFRRVSVIQVEGFEKEVMTVKVYSIPQLPENEGHLSGEEEVDAASIVVREEDLEEVFILKTNMILRLDSLNK